MVDASARRRWIAIALGVALAVAAFVMWRKRDPAGDDPAQTMKPEEAPLPAPEGLLADVYVGTPNVSWGKLQRGVGGAVGILPASAGGIICAVAGLDPFMAAEIDGTVPFYGVVAGDPGSPGFLIAMKLLDLRKARAVLVDGDTARYGARDAGGMTELVAKGQTNGPAVTVGLSANGYLLVAHRSEDLGKLAPYVTRTLPKRPLPADGAVVFDVPRAALGALLKPKLEQLWTSAKGFLLAEDARMRRDHGGREPDFGDPKAIVGALDGWVTRRIEVIGDLEKMRLAIDLVEEGVTVLATMTPASRDGAAAKWTDGMKVGDVAPLGSLPATSAAALLLRDSEEDRAVQARELESAVTTSLGPRLAEPDAKKLHNVMEDLTKARGEVLTSTLQWDEPQGLSVRAAVRDGDAASRAVRGAFDLAKVAPFKELLRVREVTSSTEEIAGLGKASVVTIAREPPREAKKQEPQPARTQRDGGAGEPSKIDAGAPAWRVRKGELGLAWLVDDGLLSIATSDTPTATLGAAVHPDRKLADEPAVARSFAALAGNASAVLLVQPLRFDPARAHLPAAPLVIALGRKDKDATLRIDIAHGILREVARRQLGL